MNKEKIAIYKELIELIEGRKVDSMHSPQCDNESCSAAYSYNKALDSIISHLKGRIEELK